MAAKSPTCTGRRKPRELWEHRQMGWVHSCYHLNIWEKARLLRFIFFSELSLESWAEVKSRYPRQVTTLVKRNIICQALGHSRVLRKVPLRTGEWTLDNQIYTTFGAMWHTSSQGTESNLTSAWVKTGLNKDKWRTSRGRWRIKRKILYLNRKSKAVIVLDSGVRGFK